MNIINKIQYFISEASDRNILTEKELIDVLKQKCKPFLTDYIKTNTKNVLYSGRKGFSISDLYVEQNVRKDRKPRDTPIKYHNMYDNAFNKLFGVKGRSQSIFVTSNKTIADLYGNLFYVVPIGEYKILWSDEVVDLYDFEPSIKLERELTKIILKNLDSKTFKIYNWYKFFNPYFKFYNFDEHFVYLAKNNEIDNKSNPTVSKKPIDPNEIKKLWMPKIDKTIDEVITYIAGQYEMGNLSGALKSDSEIMLICDKILLIDVNAFQKKYDMDFSIYIKQ